MTENKLVGSLILRTIDIDPTRAAPTTIVSTNIYFYFIYYLYFFLDS